MKVLIAEDDFTSCRLLERFLTGHTCHVAIDGREAVEAFTQAWDEGQPYDLVCLDIMMPNMDGQEALKAIRAFEEEKGIYGSKGAKVIMTTALDDFDNIMASFREQCEGYLVKPIEKKGLMREIGKLGLKEEKKA